MPDGTDKSLAGLAERLAPDTRFARAAIPRHPGRPRAKRRGPAWIIMSLAIALLVAGMMLPNGLLIAAALVLAGVAGQLLEHRGAARQGRWRG
ncbi:hypothetical protein ABZ707_31600 [Streptomyces sp. NPDC006923]|uniref:hypothetical protein n=1 Tax=Streptomyces sp. NPDC006923 TaxID=3155355 RepID=UPI0033D7ADD4